MVLPVQGAATRGAQSGPLAGRSKSAEVTPGAITAASPVDVDFAFAGAEPGDSVSVSFGAALDAGVGLIGVSVATTGHVTLRFGAFGTDRTQTAITANVSIQKPL